MKKILLIFILAFALLICGCDDAASADNGADSNTNGKTVAMSELQTFKLDAVNYDINDIDGIKKLGERGVVYAYCSSPESVNETISVLEQIPGSELTKYGTDNQNIILTLITIGEGEKSSYSIEKIEIGAAAALHVYVKTNTGDPETKKTAEYHFVRLDVPVCGEINVYLDGSKVG